MALHGISEDTQGAIDGTGIWKELRHVGVKHHDLNGPGQPLGILAAFTARKVILFSHWGSICCSGFSCCILQSLTPRRTTSANQSKIVTAFHVDDNKKSTAQREHNEDVAVFGARVLRIGDRYR